MIINGDNMNFEINALKYEINNIYIKNLIDDKSYFIGYSVFKEILDNQETSLKLKNGLLNNNIYLISIFNKEGSILEIDKVTFLKGVLQYIVQCNNKNYINKQEELLEIYRKLNYKLNINKTEVYNLLIDNQEYSFNVMDYFNFLELSDLEFEKTINSSLYKGIKIEYFIYSLLNYFKEKDLFSKYIFDEKIEERFMLLSQYQKVDCEALNKLLTTKDNMLDKINLSKDIQDILNKRYDIDTLKNIIKCYIELCKTFNYDEIYYIDELDPGAIKHLDYNYLKKITRKNNKIVCFEFTSIFGYFLNSLGIKYEIVSRSDYGIHSFLIFRYDNYLIKVEAIKSVFENDLTNVRIKFPLVGIECINQNMDTKNKFIDTLNECYKASIIDFNNDYLPSNKIENSFDYGINNYLLKIDLIFKKIKDLNLSTIDKLSYFKILIKLIFTTKELELNVFYTTLKYKNDLVFVMVLNNISL